MTPCTQKLSAQKQKRFTRCVFLPFHPLTGFYTCLSRRGAKPMGQLFGQKDPAPIDGEQAEATLDLSEERTDEKMDEDVNPF
jgi:Spo12 family